MHIQNRNQHSSPHHHSCSLHCWSHHCRNHCRPMQHQHNQELRMKMIVGLDKIINGIITARIWNSKIPSITFSQLYLCSHICQTVLNVVILQIFRWHFWILKINYNGMLKPDFFWIFYVDCFYFPEIHQCTIFDPKIHTSYFLEISTECENLFYFAWNEL